MDAVLNVIQKLDPQRHQVILACKGAKADSFLKRASRFSHIKVYDKIPMEWMNLIDVHIVTLEEHWTHICVPSKALTAISNSSTVLFLGSKKSDTWQMVGKAGWCIRKKEETHNVLAQITKESIQLKRNQASQIYKALKKVYKEAIVKIESLILQNTNEIT